MVKKYAESVIQFRWALLILSVLFMLLAGVGAKNLFFNNDYRIFFSADDPRLQAFEELQNTYTKNDNVIIVLAPKDGVVFKTETLTAIEDVTEKAWQTPYSIRVDSLSNYQHSESVEDDMSVANLFEEASELDADELSRIKAIALNEPLLLHRLISEKAHVSALNITMEFPKQIPDGKGGTIAADPTKQVSEVVTSVRELKSYIEKTYPELSVHLSGIVMMNNAFGEATIYDMSHLLPMALLLILITVFLLLRSVSGTLATLLVILFSVITAFGLAGWLGIELSSPVMSAPVIIMTLAVADCVHILSTWLSEIRQGSDKKTAMVESLRVNFMPVFLTSVTTAIGFLSLNTSDAPPFRDLGNVAAMGVIAAFIFSIFFLPAIATLLPIREKKKDTHTLKIMSSFAEWVIAKQKSLLVGMSLIAVVLISLIPINELNDVFVEYFDERIEFRRDTDFISQNLTGIYNIEYSINTENTGDISDPDVLVNIKKFTDWLNTQPEVVHVNTVTDTFTRLNKNMHGDDKSYYKLPESREMAAQYLLLYEMSLPFGLDLNNQIDIDKKSTRITVTLKTISTKQVLEMETRVDQWMEQNMPHLKAVGASPTIMFAHIGMKNIISMISGTTIALVLISLILVFALKSWRYGLLSLIPNLVPAGMAFGIWALISGEIGLALSVVTAMTLGIVVDDTIHFLSKYLRARREKGLGAEDAVRYAFSTVGVALWVTSVALVAGFLVLATSSFKLNSGMGLLTAIVIAIALIVDFLLLPPLLIKLDAWLNKDKKVTEPVSAVISENQI
ncbi:MMPL family transporter [Cocleimonas sp. KMM 6892]|uniref:efflux RND transporter permease subunit n=1 Tax=unclassified Cocleimonas TaxID=2639732 RepID=UPI002DBDFB12|nr:MULTISPECIES: MMPL family transporter [unclassified Cocleimonas]MEB8433822.1 MMPL family transporter [Cocleimonas sp. KMM 6892]MEC4716633.1 MMPL family transporter [Cocleimonas sp. KMM 6895]MEC4746212.1 MMPL family transporter [Cocleimonas sp. KMM 6896]